MTVGELKFVNVGDHAYACVTEGRAVGILYRVADEHERWGDHDRADIFWWYWMAVETPLNHLGLAAPPMLRGMSDAQLEANADVGMEAVARLLTDARS